MSNEEIDLYRDILEADPTDARALDELGRLFAEDGRWEDLVELLERRAELSIDDEAIVACRARQAEILETRLGRPDAAVETWVKVLDIDANHAAAFDALERLYEATARWVALVSILEQRVERAIDPAVTATIRERLAGICETRLGDSERASEIRKAAVEPP